MNSFYVNIAPELMQAWGEAVGAQLRAQSVNTPEAWAHSGRSWDALAALAGTDRDVYRQLAIDAWYKAAFMKSPSSPPAPIFQTPAHGVRHPGVRS